MSVEVSVNIIHTILERVSAITMAMENEQTRDQP
jgi:hypothetical protein